MTQPKIYYLIPDVYGKNFCLFGFLRSVLRCTPLKYIKNNVFPDQNKAIGGVKIMLQHCLLLNANGFNAIPVKMGEFEGNCFGYDLKYMTKEDAQKVVTPQDFVIGTEFRPYDGLEFPAARKILFIQCWFDSLKRLKSEDQNKSYHDLGYEDVTTCGDYLTSFVQAKMGIPAHTIRNGIDQAVFKPEPEKRIPGQVLVLSRKNYQDFQKIAALLKDEDINFNVVDGLTQAELAQEYKKSDIFLATGYPEGFSLPPLEAMSSGCALVGFTGGGALEFMNHGETALVADDGDCETAARHLRAILQDAKLKERLRKAGLKKASEYSLENMEKAVVDYYANVLNSSADEIAV